MHPFFALFSQEELVAPPTTKMRRVRRRESFKTGAAKVAGYRSAAAQDQASAVKLETAAWLRISTELGGSTRCEITARRAL